MQRLTRQLEEGLVEFTGGPVHAAAGHPQALVDAVRLPLRLPLPLHHGGGGHGGGQADQRQQEADELQPRTGHGDSGCKGTIWEEEEKRNRSKLASGCGK